MLTGVAIGFVVGAAFGAVAMLTWATADVWREMRRR